MEVITSLSVGESTSEAALYDQVKCFLPRGSEGRGLNENEINDKKDQSSLSEMCVHVLAKNFAENPVPFQRLPPNIARMLSERVSMKIDPCIGAQHIDDEGYWKRVCLETYQHAQCNIEEHGLSWKRLFFEKYIQNMLEAYDPGKSDFDFLIKKLARMSQNFPIDRICSTLPNLSKLNLQYVSSTQVSGLSYDRDGIGMKLSDTDSLRRTIASSSTLSSLIIQNSQVSDDAIRLLLNGLSDADASTLVHIDLSHNKITTNGVRLISKKFLDGPNSVLSSLDVSDNRIHAEGGRALGRLLRANKTLLFLDLRLNRLEDEGGKMIIEGLRDNETLRQLNLSSNSLGSGSASALASTLEAGTSKLSSVDISSNCLSEEDLSELVTSMRHNSTLVCLDVRMNSSSGTPTSEVRDNLEKEIDNILRRNELALFEKRRR